MKAVIQHRYGPPSVLRIEEIERPVPTDDEVLVRIRATTVTQTDCHARAASPFFWRLFGGLRRPKWTTLGVEFAGTVEAVGVNVIDLTPGDDVFGCPPAFGTHAEFICLPETAPIARKPATMSFDEAAAVCDGALQAFGSLRLADVGPGKRIAIYGASGSLGTAAVQIAHHLGAHVTAVCNTKNVDLVRSLGADEVVDYLREDFRADGARFDAIIDAVGKYSAFRGRRSLEPHGTYVATDLGRFLLETLAAALMTKIVGRRRVKISAGRRSKADVERLKELIEAGEFRAVIDRRYPLEAAAEAHRYVETWQKTGNVVLQVDPVAQTRESQHS